MNEDTELMLDVGQANEIKLAMRRNGWTNADIKKLCQGTTLSGVLAIVRGEAKVKPTFERTIDCDADPVIPKGSGWTVESHQKGGQLKWDSSKILLHLSLEQKYGKVIEGHKLRKELDGHSVLNANVLDYLLKHPELIPESWKGKAVLFCGTIYRRSDGALGVPFLYWRGAEWDWYCRWLGDDWGPRSPAAVLAS